MANKYLAAILSFIIPGLGQAYEGDIKKGIVYFLVASVALGIIGTFFVDSVLNSFYYIIDILISIYAAYDAYLIAKWLYLLSFTLFLKIRKWDIDYLMYKINFPNLGIL